MLNQLIPTLKRKFSSRGVRTKRTKTFHSFNCNSQTYLVLCTVKKITTSCSRARAQSEREQRKISISFFFPLLDVRHPFLPLFTHLFFAFRWALTRRDFIQNSQSLNFRL